MASSGALAFSPNCEYFAYSSPDGCLKIWETSSNILKQEYTPSAHLSSTCCTLAWGPCKHNVQQPPEKKKKSDGLIKAITDLNLIAMGTLSGEILLYSVNKGELHSRLVDGHDSAINSICWSVEEDALYSCSNDQYIVKWSISKGSVLRKWKAGKLAVHSVCAINKESILSASSDIVWWDVKTQNIIMKFRGHSTEVFHLDVVKISEDSVEMQYFISSAVGDRVISAWQLKQGGDGNAVASFTVPEEPVSVDISKKLTKKQPLVMAVVTKSGVLLVFEHQLNGRIKKPLQAKTTIQIASPASKTKSCPVPILATKISDDLQSCIVAYGNFLRPVFEKMNFRDFNGETYLVREAQLPASVTVEESISKVKEPDKPSDAKVLAPGYMTPIKPTEKIHKKRRQKDADTNDLPMEERLKAVYLGQAPEGHEVQESAKSDSMVHLLLQGLQSKDNNLLSTVLQCSDEAVIRNTIKRLPLHSITLLLKELHKRITKQEQRHHPCLRWLKGLLAIHTPYLMSCQDIDEVIGPISQLMDARTETYKKLSEVKGCLDIILSQVSLRNEDTSIDSGIEPVLMYEDESLSDEKDEDDEMENIENDSDIEGSLEDMSSEDSDEDNIQDSNLC